jgi:predicted metal-dependent HD superfamily phosphohydrolase
MTISSFTSTLFLKSKWDSLCAALAVSKDRSEAGFEMLMKRYNEPQRHYHNASHISALLHLAEQQKDLIQDSISIELAIWFHDAVYETGYPNQNEELSAQMAVDWLNDLQVAEKRITKVEMLILATKSHSLSSEVNDEDGKLFLDMDLSILSERWEVYDNYTRQIREEFILVPEMMYRMARAAAMKKFLDRPLIYGTRFFIESREKIARENILREIDSLMKQ